MKNFPHQYNSLPKLRMSLLSIRSLAAQGANAADDGVLGYRFAQDGVYTFRNFDGDLPKRIQAEQSKPEDQQGARTAAREIRRTLRFLGLIDNHVGETDLGNQLLASPQGSADELRVWQVAISRLEVVDPDGNTSHPICILLRLVNKFGQIAREEMALALEAADDSENEFQRIADLVPIRDAVKANRIKASRFQIANGVKILPALAEQAGFISRVDQAQPYKLTSAGNAALQSCLTQGPIALAQLPPLVGRLPSQTKRPVRKLASNQHVTTLPSENAVVGILSAEQQQAAMRLRFERTARHQKAVNHVADQLSLRLDLFEGAASFDLVAVREKFQSERIVLLEVKTLDADVISQTRLAVGQLLYYERFSLADRWSGRLVLKAIVFDGDIPETIASFLDWLGIGAFCVTSTTLEPLNDHGRGIQAWIVTLT
ncbi:MAG: hypothetical protein E6J20_13325 [Chloroflexi bacterium]|nr:MAG: hypothetical protein E6J20_13325 [Chloroflexota bacterium]